MATQNNAVRVLTLVATSGEMRSSMLSVMCYRDYLAFRRLHKAIWRASPALPAVPPPGGQPVPPWDIPQFLRNRLPGPTCNDSCQDYIDSHGLNHGVNPRIPGRQPGWRPCPNRSATSRVGPGSTRVRFCDNPQPQTHPARTFRVCRTCREENWWNRRRFVKLDLTALRAVMCRPCSLRCRRSQEPAPHDTCNCFAQLADFWGCFNCMNEMERNMRARIFARRFWLLRAHRVKDRKTGKIGFEYDLDNVRKLPMCPVPGRRSVGYIQKFADNSLHLGVRSRPIDVYCVGT